MKPTTGNTILGIESSCDECSASVIQYEPGKTLKVLSVATFSQIQIHQPYGGVVPEIASRNHLETINAMIEQALSEASLQSAADCDAIAVTNRPGLVGALLVGVSAAKALAYAFDKPLVPVHHLEGHALSIFLDQPAEVLSDAAYPMLMAIVSGGHTNLYVAHESPENWPVDFLKNALVGRSRDDAAGEAFDKTAKIMGFPYPGGAWIDRTGKTGNPSAFAFPRALPQKAVLDFSFSGLKTAVNLTVQKLKTEDRLEASLPDLCASIQEAIIDALISKIQLAIEKYRCRSVAIVGGVAANSRLRVRLAEITESLHLAHPPLFPHPRFCTDNAAMIAAAGAFRFQQGRGLKAPESLVVNAIANPEV